MDRKHNIRFLTTEDEPFLMQWLKDPEIMKHFPHNNEKEAAQAVKVWMNFAKYRCCLLVEKEGKPVGAGILYLMPYRKMAHHAPFHMFIIPEARRKGYGSSLLKNLKHLAKKHYRIEMLTVEIFDNGPMLPLVKKAGFTEYGVHENFAKVDGKYLARHLLECEL